MDDDGIEHMFKRGKYGGPLGILWSKVRLTDGQFISAFPLTRQVVLVEVTRG